MSIVAQSIAGVSSGSAHSFRKEDLVHSIPKILCIGEEWRVEMWIYYF